MAEWNTSRGLLSDYEGTVIESSFVTDPKYQNGEILLMEWTLETDNPENPVWTERFACGRGWESVDGGQTATRVDGKEADFQESSIYGRVINRVIGKGDGANYAEQFTGAFDVLKERNTPDHADVWLGCKFFFTTETLEFGSGLEPVNRTMPVSFLGVGDTVPTQTSTPTPTSTPNSDGELRGTLATLAQGLDDHDAFMAAALKVPGVSGNKVLLAELVDDTENGFFAKARA